MVGGPPCGYFSELTKSVFVVSTRKVLRVKAFFWGYGLQIGTGSCYLGGFVGKESEQARWLGENIVVRRYSLATLANLAGVTYQHL